MLLLHVASLVVENRESENERIEECIKRMATTDDFAFAELYKLTKDSVFGFALTILKNTHDAEDVMHDCYMSIYNSASSYCPDGKPLAWMMTITKNLCFQKMRKDKRREDIPQEDWEKYLDLKEGISVEDKLVIHACMEALNEDERKIVILHAVSGFKHREIAHILDMQVSTVLSKYNRALKKLKNQLEKESGTYE